MSTWYTIVWYMFLFICLFYYLHAYSVQLSIWIVIMSSMSEFIWLHVPVSDNKVVA